MITGTNNREDPPFRKESAEEVFLEADIAEALTSAFDALLNREGLELLYLRHEHAGLAYLDIVPLGADPAALALPEGSVRENLQRR